MKIRSLLALTASCLSLAFVASPAGAQATRTWVSGVGDDVNPCSRTAPCKTFAGAISKTAAGGEINCLDPGGFGAVTINKALTIDCHYTEGGALAGGNGIVVNAGVADVVFLRGLDIFGVNPPANGVRFIAGGALHIEDSTIRRFNAASSQGVSFQPAGTSSLFITRTTIADNGNGGRHSHPADRRRDRDRDVGQCGRGAQRQRRDTRQRGIDSHDRQFGCCLQSQLRHPHGHRFANRPGRQHDDHRQRHGRVRRRRHDRKLLHQQAERQWRRRRILRALRRPEIAEPYDLNHPLCRRIAPAVSFCGSAARLVPG
jgi:hypothetical protein